MTTLDTVDCLFCNKFFVPYSTNVEKTWYDVPVYQTAEFIAVPALGQIVPGYLLIVPRKHIFSMAQLTVKEIHSLREFCNSIAKIQSKYWGWPVIFEHGSCNEEKTSGACIIHAHWHLVPGNFDLRPPDAEFTQIESFESFAQSRKTGNPYLFYEDQDRNAYIVDVKVATSQLFRKELARLVGKEDQWDYLVFPEYENIRSTYQILTESSLE